MFNEEAELNFYKWQILLRVIQTVQCFRQYSALSLFKSIGILIKLITD